MLMAIVGMQYLATLIPTNQGMRDPGAVASTSDPDALAFD